MGLWSRENFCHWVSDPQNPNSLLSFLALQLETTRAETKRTSQLRPCCQPARCRGEPGAPTSHSACHVTAEESPEFKHSETELSSHPSARSFTNNFDF